MHFEDLTTYQYYLERELPGVKNVGWLGKANFPTGEVPPGFLLHLKGLLSLENFRVNQVRGTHPCNICGECVFDSPFVGSCELWVPDSRGCIFATPSMIVHYIEVHGYKPPEEFINAVIYAGRQQDFDGQSAYDTALLGDA